MVGGTVFHKHNILVRIEKGSHKLEKYLNLKDFLEKSLKIKSPLKSSGKSPKSLEKSLNSTFSVGLSMLIET